MKRKNGKKKLAAQLIMHWVAEAYHDLDSPYYKKFLPGEKEMIKFYIHLYGTVIGLLLHCKYKPH